LNEMLESPKIEEFGQAGRKRVEDHFSWDAVAQDTIRVYREAIAAYK